MPANESEAPLQIKATPLDSPSYPPQRPVHAALRATKVKCRLDPHTQLSRNSRLGKIESYTRSCVFLIAPLAAESHQKNAFPYDDLVSGRGVYAYVGGNPLSRIDRFGLAGGPPEADETEEQREENESALVEAEAARLQAEIRALDPGYGEALPPGYRPSALDLIRLERLVKEMREEQRCRNPAVQSPLRRAHSDQTLTSGYSQYTYGYWRGQSTRDIVNSLQPNAPDPLTVRPDGTVLDGNTRLLILQQRGYDVNSLPRTIIR
jgi:hypothetical protein